MSTRFGRMLSAWLRGDVDPGDAEAVGQMVERLEIDLDLVRRDRRTRLTAVTDRLTAAGLELTVDDVLAQADPAATVGRPHVADAMIAGG